MINQKIAVGKTDVLLAGAGIMSATLAMFLKELNLALKLYGWRLKRLLIGKRLWQLLYHLYFNPLVEYFRSFRK